jgi:hypothetical protein
VSLTLFKRIDIDVDWYFTAVSVGFTLHRRGFQLSLVFFDISFYYISPKRRAEIAKRVEAAKAIVYAMEEEQWYEG